MPRNAIVEKIGQIFHGAGEQMKAGLEKDIRGLEQQDCTVCGFKVGMWKSCLLSVLLENPQKEQVSNLKCRTRHNKLVIVRSD